VSITRRVGNGNIIGAFTGAAAPVPPAGGERERAVEREWRVEIIYHVMG